MRNHLLVVRVIICYVLTGMLLIGCCGTALAVDYPQKQFSHDEFLYDVLIDKNQYKPSTTKDDWIKMLQYASYLCVDQYNNNQVIKEKSDQDRLTWLSSKVSGLPKSVDDLNPPKGSTMLSGTNHRTYTHMGWGYPYKDDRANSKLRMIILRNTVKTVFDFKLSPQSAIGQWFGSLTRAEYSDKQCEAFCKLIYYVHVLGDCYEDENFKQANGDNNGRKIPLGRAHSGNSIEDTDILSELIKLMPDLFSERVKNGWSYPEFINKLEGKRHEITQLYSTWGQINTEEKFIQYHKLTSEVMDILIDDMPKMLFNEPFFSNKFYQ